MLFLLLNIVFLFMYSLNNNILLILKKKKKQVIKLFSINTGRLLRYVKTGYTIFEFEFSANSNKHAAFLFGYYYSLYIKSLFNDPAN